MNDVLTSTDLDGLGRGLRTDPRGGLDTLVRAVDEGRLADPEDASYALSLASSAALELRDGERSLDLARRAVEAAGDRDRTVVRGELAELLMVLGRPDEAMTELRGIRPQLTRDPLAGDHIVDTLVLNGRADLAEEWLTAALATARDIVERTEPDTDAAEDGWEIVDHLVVHRFRVRAGLGREPDEDDLLGEEIADELDARADAVFWPREAFEALVAGDPSVAGPLGGTWDGHRAAIERALQDDDELLVEVAEGERDGDAPGPVLEWPPGRNAPCWCGSGSKYKKCCLPRGRG